MKHSAGIIIETPNGFLACHPTFKPKKGPYWDIPKGGIDDNETPFDTMIRELEEETGIILRWPVIDYGVKKYISSKDLHVFYTRIDEDIDTSLLRCTSKFNHKGKMVPEMDGYMITKDINIFYPELQTIIQNIIQK